MNISDSSFILDQMRFVSNFQDVRIILLVSISLPVLFLYYKNYKIESILMLATTISYPYTLLLKHIFKLPRPSTNDLNSLFRTDLYGFPSGHTIFYTIFFGFLIYLSFRTPRISRTVRKFVQWISIYFIVMVGASRVGLGVHYVRDILAGYLFGILFLFLLIKLHIQLKNRKYPVAKNKN